MGAWAHQDHRPDTDAEGQQTKGIYNKKPVRGSVPKFLVFLAAIALPFSCIVFLTISFAIAKVAPWALALGLCSVVIVGSITWFGAGHAENDNAKLKAK
jgi:hypothetical protein